MGMIIDCDIVLNCVVDGKDCNIVYCYDCMIKDVIICFLDMDIYECVCMMVDY